MISQSTNVGSYAPGSTAPSASAGGSAVKAVASVPPVGTGAKPVVVDADAVRSAVDQINTVLKHFNSDLEFSVDTETKTNIVKVVDTVTKEVIRQMPSQDMIEISKALDKLQGLLIRGKA